VARLQPYATELPGFLLVAAAEVTTRPGDAIEVVVRKTAMARCDRCWTHRADVRPAADGANLCGRCVTALEAAARRAGIGAG
jgi:hypothetical protein